MSDGRLDDLKHSNLKRAVHLIFKEPLKLLPWCYFKSIGCHYDFAFSYLVLLLEYL